MATNSFTPSYLGNIQSSEEVKIGIVISKWNDKITENLLTGALNKLGSAGIQENNIRKIRVPGSFELALGAQQLLNHDADLSGVICIGCVIRGETQHFKFVSDACSKGIMEVSLKYNKPVVFGVLTDDNESQSLARSGGALGNKGEEAAISLLSMIGLKQDLDKT